MTGRRVVLQSARQPTEPHEPRSDAWHRTHFLIHQFLRCPERMWTCRMLGQVMSVRWEPYSTRSYYHGEAYFQFEFKFKARSNVSPASEADDAVMCIDHTDVTQAEPNASPGRGKRHGSRWLHESGRKCSCAEKCRLELLLTSSASRCDTYVLYHLPGRGDLKRSVVPHSRAFTSSRAFGCSPEVYSEGRFIFVVKWNCRCRVLRRSDITVRHKSSHGPF